jgi:hypothetical protein
MDGSISELMKKRKIGGFRYWIWCPYLLGGWILGEWELGVKVEEGGGVGS